MQIVYSIPFISRSRTIFPFYRVGKLSFQLTTEPSFITENAGKKENSDFAEAGKETS